MRKYGKRCLHLVVVNEKMCVVDNHFWIEHYKSNEESNIYISNSKKQDPLLFKFYL